MKTIISHNRATLTNTADLEVTITGAGYVQNLLLATDANFTISDGTYSLRVFIDGEITPSTDIPLERLDYNAYIAAAADSRPVDWIVRDQTNFIHAITLNYIFPFNTSIRLQFHQAAIGQGDMMITAPAVVQ